MSWWKFGAAAFVTTLLGAWRTDYSSYRASCREAGGKVAYDWGLMGERVLGALDAAVLAAVGAAGLSTV
jgi:hypothetical protein